MGYNYIECESCETCYGEDHISIITIEGYAQITICKYCRDEEMNSGPSEGFYRGEFFATFEGHTEEFDGFNFLESFILGEPEDESPPHLEYTFGIKGGKTIYTASKENLEKCKLEAWEKDYKHDDNTVFTPKPEWFKRELESVSGQIEQLSGKKQKLEKILQNK